MPWRRNIDPYRVWISEIMLQQTRVDTVIPYYRRFLKTFPTLRRLAQADLHQVLQVWEGLGYYSRARHLHQAAREIIHQRGGHIPDSASELARLPGIGPYTAAAIASICFKQPTPCVDGNVARVFSRFFGLAGRAADPRFRAGISARLTPLIPTRTPGDFNQAVMELGATLCTPRKPDCPACPLRNDCVALASAQVDHFPTRAPVKRIPHLNEVACLIRRNNRLLIAQRRSNQMLGGLWEFPGGSFKPGEAPEQAAHREILERIGIAIQPRHHLPAIQHAYTHFRVTIHPIQCQYVSGQARPIQYAAVRWVLPQQLKDFPFPVTHRRINSCTLPARAK